MTVVIFVGPSLDLALARHELEACFRPPICRGDLDVLLAGDTPPTAVGIIDGKFFQTLCISPKEVLRSIDAGVAMFGASSMGALRAVECAPYGMIGVGRIYAEYASGRVDGDDEVAITYEGETGRALSEPLINWRLALAAGVAAGKVDSALADRFLTVAKGIYFPQRTVSAVLRLLAGEVGGPPCVKLADYLGNEALDAKRDDAIALLRQMRRFYANSDSLGPPAVPVGGY